MKNMILLVVLIVISGAAFAAKSDNVNLETISIDGQFEQKPLTHAEKMKILRKKLEKKNELMVKKKIEMLRYQQEVEMYKKMEAAMNKMLTNTENALNQL